MVERTELPARVEIPAADSLYVNTLRAALASYERGDYRRAADLFGDAAAVGGRRPEAAIWAVIGASLELALLDGALVSRDAALPAESAAAR